MLHFNTISDLRREIGFDPPEHPQLSLVTGLKTCPLDGRAFTTNCYMISLKRFSSGLMLYGRTAYDHDNGVLSFIKPRQVIEFRNLHLEEEGFMLCIHEDYLNGDLLHDEIQQYHFFDYEINEALHLAPGEEQIIRELFRKIEAEYYNNQDEYSRAIILTHIDSMLKYSARFYKRQFINRAVVSGKIVSRFNEALSAYIRKGLSRHTGLPTVSQLAQSLHVSPRYLSDLLKQETGKTAVELIHISLVAEAKNRLRNDAINISQVAFDLGFENPSYFSKVFRKQAGITPAAFKKTLMN